VEARVVGGGAVRKVRSNTIEVRWRDKVLYKVRAPIRSTVITVLDRPTLHMLVA